MERNELIAVMQDYIAQLKEERKELSRLARVNDDNNARVFAIKCTREIRALHNAVNELNRH